jgi:hypothetical protein
MTGDVRFAGVIERHRGIEINEADLVPLVEAHVLRLQVQVQDAATVDVGESVRDFCRDPHDVINRQQPARLTGIGEKILEGASREVTSCHEGRFAFAPPVEDCRDVLVIAQVT